MVCTDSTKATESSERAAAAAEQHSDSSAWLTIGRFALILAGLIFIAYPQVVLGFHSFVWRDYGLFGYPLAHYHKECFWRGEIPLWNPYNNFGIPYLAQWGTMVVYPPSLIYLLLPLPWSLGLFMFLHQLLGGIGMFVLARRWGGNSLAAGVAGIAFAFNGFMLNCLMWPNYVASMGWMPWVVLTHARACKEGGRSILVAAFVGGMQMLSGTPEVILLTWIFAGGMWFVEKAPGGREWFVSARRCAVVVLFVAALAAVQLLPFLDLLQHSSRAPDYDDGRWPLPGSGWANLFVPLFRMFPTGAGVFFHAQQNLTSSYYVGVIVIVAGLLALAWRGNRRMWFLFCATTLMFIYAMGKNTPVYDWLRTGFPATGFMRYPTKLVIALAFAWPLLAACGLAAFLAMRSAPDATRRSYVAIGLVGLAVLIIAGIMVHAYWVPYRGLPAQPIVVNGAVRIAFLLAIFGTCWWLTRAMEAKRRTLLQVAVLMLVYFDFVSHAPQQNPTVDDEALTVAIPWLKHMQPRPALGESRAALNFEAITKYLRAGTSNVTETYIAQRNGLFCNVNLLEGIPKADGFYALYIAEERQIQHRFHHTSNEVRSALGRFVGVSQVISPTNIVIWEPRTNYLPLITAGQLPVFKKSGATIAALVATNFMPERTVYLPPEAAEHVRVTTPGAARIIAREVTPHKVSAEVSASAPSLVVIAQTHYPRWKAFVDGEPVVLLRANHAFQAVQVPTGKHRVDVIYQDRPFQIGAALSFGAFSVLLGGWARYSRKRTIAALDQDNMPAGRHVENYLPPFEGEGAAPLPGGTSTAKGSCGL